MATSVFHQILFQCYLISLLIAYYLFGCAVTSGRSSWSRLRGIVVVVVGREPESYDLLYTNAFIYIYIYTHTQCCTIRCDVALMRESSHDLRSSASSPETLNCACVCAFVYACVCAYVSVCEFIGKVKRKMKIFKWLVAYNALFFSFL